MEIEEALRWVDNNCYDEATVQRLRSRKVARTLSNEIERLRVEVEKWKSLADASSLVAESCQRRIEREHRLTSNAE